MDAYLLHQYCEAAAALEAAGLRGPQRLRFLVEVRSHCACMYSLRLASDGVH